MTAHHHFDRLRVDPPQEAPDYSGADLQLDATDEALVYLRGIGIRKDDALCRVNVRSRSNVAA